MSSRGVLIVGSGKRVRETALPAFLRASSLDVRRIVARTVKTIEVEGREHEVGRLADVEPAHLDGVDLIYVSVGKDAVPQVLARLHELEPANRDVLIDTPVVRFKHFRHARRLDAFRTAWVAEDAAYLPWIPLIRRAAEEGPLGEVRHLRWMHSAWAYHGIATSKALLGDDRVARGRLRASRRELRFARGGTAWVAEPRDYSTGSFAVIGSQGVAADSPEACLPGTTGELKLEAIADGPTCRGLRLGDLEERFDEAEVELAAGDREEASVTARTEAMKRVGFLRLLRAIEDGRGGYPIEQGLDDMVVDYHLEKVGIWLSNPLTSPRSATGRRVLGALTRLGGS